MRKAVRIILWILGGVLLLLLLVIIGIQTRPGKNFIREQAVAFLRNKLKTEVHIGGLDYALPKMIVLKDVLLKDQAEDTLLSAREIKVDIAMLQLINNKVDIRQVYLDGVYAHIYRKQQDTVFNFDYIVKAFVSQENDTATASKDTTAGLQMNLDKLVLHDIVFRFNDTAGGIGMHYEIGDVNLTMDKLDPEQLTFKINRLYANHFKAIIVQGESILPEDTTTSEPLSLQIAAKEIDLNNVYYNQQSLTNHFFMDVQMGRLLTHPGNIDLTGQSFDIKDFLLANTSVAVTMGGRAAELAAQVADTLIDPDVAPSMKWRVTAGDLTLDNVNFKLDDQDMPAIRYGMDYAHLDVRNLHLKANDIFYTTDTIEGFIDHLAVKEKSGLDIQKLTTRFAYHPQGAFLRDLYLQTPQTILQDYLWVKYPSLDALAAKPGLTELDIHLKNSVIGIKDILLFAPDLGTDPFFRKHKNGMIRLETDLSGKLDALDIQRFYVSGLGSTEIDIRGIVYGAPDPDRLRYNLTISKLQSSRNDIETLLPRETVSQIRLPDRFALSGKLSGTAQSYQPNLLLFTTDGNASVSGIVDMSRGTGKERYNLSVKTKDLNIGRIIRNPDLETITADLAVHGNSFDIDAMNAVAQGRIHTARYNQYTYRDIRFEGNIADKKAGYQLVSTDPNLQVSVDGNASFEREYPAIYANAMIDSVDLEALNFSDSEMRFHGKVEVAVATLNPDYPEAVITVSDPIMTTKGRRYLLDSISLVARPGSDSGNNIQLNAKNIYAHIWGHTPLTRIGDIVQHHINRHYTINDSIYLEQSNQPVSDSLYSDHDLNLVARIQNNPVLEAFVPDLHDLDTIVINAGVSPQRLYLNAELPGLRYLDYTINNATVRVNGTDSALTYEAAVDRIYQNNIDIWFTNISGNLSTNSLSSDISIGDPDSNQRFRISALLQRNGEEQIFTLQPGLILNYENWNVRQPNRIVFSSQGFYVEHFGINQGTESIEVNSETASYNAPLKADISNFMLSNLTEIISGDTLLANGMLGGNVNILRFNPSPQITSEMNISNLSVLGETIGNVDITIRNATEAAIDAHVGITGKGNDISLDGLYYPEAVNGNNLNMTLKLSPLNLAAFEGAAQHQIRNTSGGLRGDLKISGTNSLPSINGTLRTEKLRTTITMLGTPFYMENEQIAFRGQNITLNKFNIRDSASNLATVNGTMNFQDMNLAMRVRANNWQAMSATANDNKDLYGRLFLSTNIGINGPISAPDVDGTLNILKGTTVNITIPPQQTSLQETEGIVEFINIANPYYPNILMPRNTDTVRKITKVPVGSHVNLNISTDEEAEFSVVIDEGTGDFVKVRGAANLNTFIQPDGSLGLTGNYEIKDGFYQFSYNFIRREFRIQPGSTIVFAGDPMEAELDVTAFYEANVPPYDLVSRQVQDPAELVFFKQRLPFEVRMKISGPMMHPELAFDVVLPEEKNYPVAPEVTDLVQARLNLLRNEPSELNKQVFALIILNRFVAEDPFHSGAGGGGAEAIARQSVSRFVSEQLNKFAGGLIAGLDLTLDLQSSEDYTTGERRNRTDLNLGASKRLLNDRLTINVGNNFQLEGPQSNNTQGTSFIPGNIAIDYDLTSNRRYRVRVFRRDEEAGRIEGNIISTGASFIFQVDYNRFRYVLMNRKRRQRFSEERRKRREQNEEDEPSTSARIKPAIYFQEQKENGTD